jgi:hypothetical protein
MEKLKATIAQQQKQIEALTASFGKVNEQLQFSKAVPQLAANNQYLAAAQIRI